MAKLTLSFLAILLLCISFGDAKQHLFWGDHSSDMRDQAVLDRSLPTRSGNEYYATPVDTTTINVTGSAVLVEVVLPELFLMNRQGSAVTFEAPIEAVLEIIRSNTSMWRENVTIRPNEETTVTIQSTFSPDHPPKVILEGNNTYEIVVRLPEGHIYAFNGDYSRKEFYVEMNVQIVQGAGKVDVTFVEPNQDHDDAAHRSNRSPSVGMVKKLILRNELACIYASFDV